MKVNISFICYTSYLFFIIISINSFAQVVERNGILFRDFQFNNDTLKNQLFVKNDGELLSGDTIRLPFIKPDFIVNSFDGEYGADQNRVCGAMDGSGNYAFAWIDYRLSQEQIYAQFFNSNDQRIGANFLVNEDPLMGNNSPFIAANKEGEFVIVWLRNFRDVMAQRYNKDGQKVGNNILINIVSGWNTSEPSVAVNSDGSFMVMWASQSGSGNYKVYARLIDSSGNPVGQDILVTDTSLGSSSIGRGRTIDIDETGKYCLTWSSYSASSSSKIFLQVINSSGQKLGSNIMVSSPGDNSRNYFPDIASTDDGHFLIVWEKDYGYPFGGGVGGRIYHSDGYFVTDEFMIFTDSSSSWHPVSVSSDRDSIFILFWLGNGTQYLQTIKSNGEFESDTIRVRYNSVNPVYSYMGGLTDVFDNHFFIAPEVYERNDANIYLQKYDNEMQPIGPLTKLHDDYGSAWQKKPMVRFNKEGASLIMWEDQRNGRYDLYAQVYDKNLNPVGNNIQINDVSTEYWFLRTKEVQPLSNGTFVIAFCGSDYYDADNVLLQLVGSSGEKIGQNKIVKERNYSYQYDIALSINDDDEILITWYNLYGAYIQRFDKDLKLISSVNILMTSTYPIRYSPITISIDSAFNVMAMWMDYDYQNYQRDNKIKGRFFNEEGKSVSNVFIIDSVNSYITNFECKNEGQNYALLYKDGSKIYLKRNYDLDKKYSFENSFYSYSYTPIQTNIVEFSNQKIFITYNSNLTTLGFYANDNKRITETYLLHQYEYIDPYYDTFNGTNSTDLFEDKIIFTYESNSNPGTGYDIWANVRKIESIDFTPELFYPPVSYDILYNNFPNPFNSKTKIAYEILAFHKVKLAVYDILGREVKVLVNENQEKGLYEIEFDAANLASGIYFYKLEAFKTSVKKMMLLK